MAKLDKEFRVFYNEEVKFAANRETLDKKKQLKDDFACSFPSAFKDKFGEDYKATNIRFIDQGSYSIGTTINHGNTAYDIDIAAILELDITSYSNPVEIKAIARDALTNNNRQPLFKEPCISVTYTKEGEEKYHIDFPIYANCGGSLYLARGRENSDESNRKWETADPEGLNDYFKLHNLQIEGLNLSTEAREQRNQKRRLIRYLKWWKAEQYPNARSDNEVPPSIALTLLVCRYFKQAEKDGRYNDLDSLFKTVTNIMSEIFYAEYDVDLKLIRKVKECNLPEKPYSDTLTKLRGSNNHVQKFYDKMEYLRKQLEFAVNQTNEREAGEAMCKVFGAKFPLPEEDKANEQDSFAK